MSSDQPPDGYYQKARLKVRLGVLVPAGKEGWVSVVSIGQDAEGRSLFRFLLAANHDLAFKVYAEEIDRL